MTLKEHIAACQARDGLTVFTAGPALGALRAALAADPDMVREAQATIAEGLPVEPRDHITRQRNALLRQALGEHPDV